MKEIIKKLKEVEALLDERLEADSMEENKKEPYSGKSDSDFYKDIQSQYNRYKKGDYDKLKNKD